MGWDISNNYGVDTESSHYPTPQQKNAPLTKAEKIIYPIIIILLMPALILFLIHGLK